MIKLTDLNLIRNLKCQQTFDPTIMHEFKILPLFYVRKKLKNFVIN